MILHIETMTFTFLHSYNHPTTQSINNLASDHQGVAVTRAANGYKDAANENDDADQCCAAD